MTQAQQSELLACPHSALLIWSHSIKPSSQNVFQSPNAVLSHTNWTPKQLQLVEPLIYTHKHTRTCINTYNKRKGKKRGGRTKKKQDHGTQKKKRKQEREKEITNIQSLTININNPQTTTKEEK